MATLNVVSICGSLRKGSFNAMVQRLLPSLAPDGMTIKPAPSFADFPLYNADIQNSTSFPAPVNTLADAIRAADGVIFCTPEYNFGIPGGLPLQPWAAALLRKRTLENGKDDPTSRCLPGSPVQMILVTDASASSRLVVPQPTQRPPSWIMSARRARIAHSR